VSDYNTTTTLPTAPTKTGYTFASWNTLANGTGTAFTSATAVTDNLIVYAQWELTVAPTITNSSGAVSIAFTSANAECNLTDDGYGATTVIVYWGNNDGATTTGAWDGSINLGVHAEGNMATALTGLNPNVNYFYRCYATNSAGEDWADSTSNFTTLIGSNSPVIFRKGLRFLHGFIFK
jgi:uncharacterized repeat protein (TIGR02543 family)